MKRWDLVADGMLLLAAAAVAVQFAIVPRHFPDLLDGMALFMIASLPGVVLGAVIAHRRPANAVGPVLMLVGLLPLLVLAADYWGLTATTETPWPAADLAHRLAQSGWMWMYIGPIALALLFPTGRLLSPRWRVVAAGCVLVPLVFAVLGFPILPEAVQGPWAAFLLLALLGLLVAAAVSVGLRYRRGDEELRRQLRWFGVTAVLAPVALFVCWIVYVLLGGTSLVEVALCLSFVTLAVSVAIAMLRHGLYGFDRLLSGTVRWGVMVGLLGLLFAAVALLLGSLLGGDSPVVAATATLACAVAFRPVHRVVRRAVDARVQPRREQTLRALRSFVADVHSGTADPEGLEAVLRRATGDPLLRIDSTGPSTSIVAGPGSTLTAADLRDIEDEARLPLELARLREDLREALDQTDASRARLVKAADDERRRIRRDLHDGAQQNLVALGMRLRSLQRGTPATQEVLGEAVELVQRTIVDLRSLAQGVRPSSLDEGLAPALRAMVRAVPLRVDLDLQPVSVGEPSATAAYYVVAEAVTNTLKHGKATRIGISLEPDNAGMRLLVEDDGEGGASETRGSGLSGIRDRVEAAGGSLHVHSHVNAGTRIEAVLPCGS